MSGMPARSAAVRSAVMFSMHSRRRASAPGMSKRLTHTQAASRRTAWPMASSMTWLKAIARRLLAVDVGDVDAQHEGGLVAARDALQQRRLADRELDRVGGGRRRASAIDLRHVLDAGQEARLAEEAVVDRDVDAAARARRGRGGSGGRRRTRLDPRHRFARRRSPDDGQAPCVAGSRGRGHRRPQPHHRSHAGDRRAAPGRGAALRARRGDAGRQGRQRRAGGARPGRSRGARRPRAGAHGRRPARRCWATRGSSLRGVEVGGELRSTAVVLERSGRVTVLNEPGPALAARRVGASSRARWPTRCAASACWRAAARCRRARPPTPTRGWSASAHARGRGGDRRRRRRAARRRRVAAGADVVTPNLAEAEGLLHGRADETVEAGDVASCASARWRPRGRSSSAGRRARW